MDKILAIKFYTIIQNQFLYFENVSKYELKEKDGIFEIHQNKDGVKAKSVVILSKIVAFDIFDSASDMLKYEHF